MTKSVAWHRGIELSDSGSVSLLLIVTLYGRGVSCSSGVDKLSNGNSHPDENVTGITPLVSAIRVSTEPALARTIYTIKAL